MQALEIQNSISRLNQSMQNLRQAESTLAATYLRGCKMSYPEFEPEDIEIFNKYVTDASGALSLDEAPKIASLKSRIKYIDDEVSTRIKDPSLIEKIFSVILVAAVVSCLALAIFFFAKGNIAGIVFIAASVLFNNMGEICLCGIEKREFEFTGFLQGAFLYCYDRFNSDQKNLLLQEKSDCENQISQSMPFLRKIYNNFEVRQKVEEKIVQLKRAINKATTWEGGMPLLADMQKMHNFISKSVKNPPRYEEKELEKHSHLLEQLTLVKKFLISS